MKDRKISLAAISNYTPLYLSILRSIKGAGIPMMQSEARLLFSLLAREMMADFVFLYFAAHLYAHIKATPL